MKRNSELVLDLLGGEAEGLTRAQIRARTGLSKPTVQSIVAELRESRRIIGAPQENGNGDLSGGRPPERFVLTPDAGLVVGIDVGHGHLRVMTADRSGRMVGEVSEDETIDVDGAGIAALRNVVDLIERSLASGERSAAEVRAVTIGIPAAIDRKGTVLFSDSLASWATVNIGDELFKLLRGRFDRLEMGRRELRVENDANLGAVGEGCRGAAVGARHYVYVKVSSGIGMGLVMRGELYRGAEGAAGEFGHTTVSPMAAPFVRSIGQRPLRPCRRCSKLDCVENQASGQAILRQLDEQGERSVSDRQIEELVKRATTDAVSHRTELQAIVDAGTRIGYTLTDVVRVYAPEVIVVGGLMAEAGDTLVQPIKDAIAGMKGLPAVRVEVVSRARIRRSEVDGAIAIAARMASRVASS